MAPSPGDLYKDYFDDPTFSDLTIRLSDRKVHVHHIVLCRRSRYFNKLILNGFKESSLNEVTLHGDDPVVMMALLQYIYDLPYEDLHEDSETEWQFLANVYIAADKYEVAGLTRSVTEQMKLMLSGESYLGSAKDDFLAAVKLIFDNTTSEDDIGREAMVDLCVCCIRGLKGLPDFDMLLSECDGLGAMIFAHERLGLMLEGTWVCGDDLQHSDAMPRCSLCSCKFPTLFIRAHRHESVWECPCCDKEVRSVCTEHPKNGKGAVFECKWVWGEEE